MPLAAVLEFDLPVILFHQVNPDYEEDDLECQSSVSIGKGMVLPLTQEGLAQAQGCPAGPGFLVSEETENLTMLWRLLWPVQRVGVDTLVQNNPLGTELAHYLNPPQLLPLWHLFLSSCFLNLSSTPSLELCPAVGWRSR